MERSKQLAVHTYPTWLMNDGIMPEAVVIPLSFPNLSVGGMVRSTLLVPSVLDTDGER